MAHSSDFDKWREFQIREERRKLVCMAIVVATITVGFSLAFAHAVSILLAHLAAAVQAFR